MALNEYGVVKGREYRGIVYRIDMIPSRKIYKVSFSNYNIKPFFPDEHDTISEIEKDARESIDEFLDNKR